MILFLDRMVLPGSTLHILCPLSVEARRAIFAACEFDEHALVNLHIDHHVGDASVLRHVMAYHDRYSLSRLTSIVVLSGSEGVPEEDIMSDCRTLATVMLLQGLRGGQNVENGLEAAVSCNAILEILDERTMLVAAESPGLWANSDFIKSNELISKMLAMVSHELDMKQILDKLFSSGGMQLTLMPAAQLAGTADLVSFWELSRECALRHESCLVGYLEEEDEDEREEAGEEVRRPPRCVLNPPDKDVERYWGANIQFILLVHAV